MGQEAVIPQGTQPVLAVCERVCMVLSPAQADLSGFADLLCERRAGDIRVTHKSYSHDFEQSWHEHNSGSIDFILEGGGVGTYAGREVISSPGVVEFFREEIRHRFRSYGSGIRTMHVLLPAELISELPQLRDIALEELRHTRAVALASMLLSELHTPDASSGMQIESLVHELLDEITSTLSGPNPRAGWIGHARDALHEAEDRPLSLSQLAELIGIDRAHLARTFKAKLGMSVGAYHRRIRLERASRLIASTDDALVRIAQCCGFADQAHFTRVFHAHMGTTPSRFRQSLCRR